jgi:hypothetical protein
MQRRRTFAMPTDEELVLSFIVYCQERKVDRETLRQKGPRENISGIPCIPTVGHIELHFLVSL